MKRIANFIAGIFFVFAVLFVPTTFGQLAEIKTNFPKNMPLKIEFKNYDKADWWHDLEIKVTNTGNKPIYYLYLILYTDAKDPKGERVGFTFKFGDTAKLYSTEAIAGASDPSILPNESYTFTVNSDTGRAWDFHKSLRTFAEPRKAELRCNFINFGDGTGIEGGGTHFKKKTLR